MGGSDVVVVGAGVDAGLPAGLEYELGDAVELAAVCSAPEYVAVLVGGELELASVVDGEDLGAVEVFQHGIGSCRVFVWIPGRSA